MISNRSTPATGCGPSESFPEHGAYGGRGGLGRLSLINAPTTDGSAWGNIPPELTRNRRQWVLGRLADKVPFDGKTQPIRTAKSTDPGTWATFQQCAAAAGTKYGLGFVLTESDPYVIVDLDWKKGDDAGEKHQMPGWAQEFLDALDAKYCEWSVSGRGCHAIVTSDQLDVSGNGSGGGKRNWTDSAGAEHEVEIYTSGRYILLTGNVLQDRRRNRIVDRTERLVGLIAGSRPGKTFKAAHGAAGGCGCESHKVDSGLMLGLLAGLGIALEPGRDKGKFDCPFHDTGCGSPTFHVNRHKGWTCFGESCKLAGGSRALAEKLAALTDDELGDVARRTGMPRKELESLKTRCGCIVCPDKPITSLEGKSTRLTGTKYAASMKLGPASKATRYCGYNVCVINEESGTIRPVWIPCGSWDCDLCGPGRRAEYEAHLVEKLTEETALGGEVYHGLVTDSRWKALRKAVKRAGGNVVGFRTEHVGRWDVIASVDFSEHAPLDRGGCNALTAEEIQPAVEGILMRMRRKAFARERLVVGSRAWHLATSATRRKAEKAARAAAGEEGKERVLMDGSGENKRRPARCVDLDEAADAARDLGLEVEVLAKYQTWAGPRPGNLRIHYGNRLPELLRRLGLDPKEQSEEAFWRANDDREDFFAEAGVAS